MNPNLQVAEIAMFMGYRCLCRKGEEGSQWLFKPDSQPVRHGHYWQLERVVGEFIPAELNREWASRRDDGWMFATIPAPDYLNDLNLMHLAAMKLKAESRYQYAMYLSRLDKLTGLHSGDVHLEDAPAALRAEALLKTLKKWTTE